MTQFQFEPYVGTLPIRFGMTPAQVEQIVGPPAQVGQNFLGERDEQRGGVNVRYSKTATSVVEVSLLPAMQLLLDSRDLFRERDPIQTILQYDPNPFEWVGFIIFLEIGLAITGYHDDDASQRAITAFCKGRWDPYRDQFSEFRQPNHSRR